MNMLQKCYISVVKHSYSPRESQFVQTAHFKLSLSDLKAREALRQLNEASSVAAPWWDPRHSNRALVEMCVL